MARIDFIWFFQFPRSKPFILEENYWNLGHTARWDTIFSHIYLSTWVVDLIEILEIMAQMWQYVIFLSLKSTKVTSDFILN